ncbi:MAG: hypothetical protein JWN14_938 [Chthonomonadales bacterium]|nr:hypothetical protein [Chthonomonadales bacterium]
MADSQQPTPNKTDAWAHLQAAASVHRSEEEDPSPPLPSEAEIEKALQQVRINDHSLTGILDSFRDHSLSRPPARPLPTEMEDLLAILRQESRKRARRILLSRLGALFFLVAGLFFPPPKYERSLSMILCIWVPACLLGMGAQASPKQKAAAPAISRFDDARAVGPLAEAAEFPDRYIRSIARRSLLHLLPHLKASDAVFLSAAHRSSLNKILRKQDIDLILAVLKAWEQVGDASAIPDVQNLAEGRGEAGQLPKVVRAAKECLPFLRQSAERQGIGAQLLRASDGGLTPTDALLRPIQAHSPTESPEQLLRPNSDAV